MSRPVRDQYDVVVVGCGPVGALGAALFAQAGFDTLVVERATDVYDLPRAIHFDAQIMRLLQQVGIADDYEHLTRPWRRSVFTGADGELLRVHDFPVERVEGWAPHSLFYQPELERALRRAAIDHGAELRLGTTLVDIDPGDAGIPATLTLRDSDGRRRMVSAEWVIACDGAASTVRKQLEIGLDDMEFDEPWLVVDANVADQTELPRESRMVCDPVRPSTVIEGRGDHRRWEFMVLPDEDPDEVAEPERVASLVGEWIDPSKVDIVRAAVYRFHGLVATSWRRARVFLAGDAAHQTPPFLGQGMCHGMRDVSNLSWKLAAVVAGSARPELLDSYEDERKPHVEEIIAMAVRSGRDVCILDPAQAAERDREIREQAGRNSLPPSPFIGMPPLRTGWLGDGEGTGALFPQPFVEVDGATRRLDDITRGWAVVVGPQGDATMSLDDHVVADRFGLSVVHVVVDRDRLHDEATGSVVAVDTTNVVGRWMEDHGCGAVLVRPDRYVYAAGRGAAEMVVAMLCSIDASSSGVPE